MKYLSLCSGIEAATVAWHPLGWEAVAYSEIERFPSEVLAHHYPSTPNLGDMTKFKEWNFESDVDLLVGGTPCQSFSVAGLRKGLDDPRGNLMLTYLAIADKFRPRWLVWENVPGVLSSGGGADFGTFLGALGELGYGFAYRILDAQYFGVAQRRRRVFVVGCFGDWRSAAAVLFERHSLSGNPAPSREKRKEVTNTTRVCADDGGRFKDGGMNWPASVAPTLDAHYGDKMGLENQHINSGGGYIPSVAKCLITKTRLDMETETMIVLMDQGGGVMNVLEDGTVGTLRRETHGHEPVVIALAENTIVRQPENGGNGDGFTVGGPMYTLNATGVHGVATPTLTSNGDAHTGFRDEHGLVTHTVYDTTNITSPANGSNPKPNDPCFTLAKGQHPPLLAGMAVRRLTPVECEALQGFQKDYTNIPWRNKQESPDGPRYKSLGNSMAVPVMNWIGKRISKVSEIKP